MVSLNFTVALSVFQNKLFKGGRPFLDFALAWFCYRLYRHDADRKHHKHTQHASLAVPHVLQWAIPNSRVLWTQEPSASGEQNKNSSNKQTPDGMERDN